MVAVPVVLPVTVPSVPTVATIVLELLQVPPPVASVSAVFDPWHTLAVPVMIAGCVFTVTTAVAVQVPPLYVYVIVDVPTPVLVTSPVVEPIVAASVLLLLQVPPVVESLKLLVEPLHIDKLPKIGLVVVLMCMNTFFTLCVE